MVALVVVGAVPAVTPTMGGLTTLPDMVEQTPVGAVEVVPETAMWTNTLSTAEVTAQETAVPEARVL
jgi:hypothetical protein